MKGGEGGGGRSGVGGKRVCREKRVRLSLVAGVGRMGCGEGKWWGWDRRGRMEGVWGEKRWWRRRNRTRLTLVVGVVLVGLGWGSGWGVERKD
jgi:hypothetical protein